MNQIELFFDQSFPKNTYHHVLQKFLNNRRKRISEHTVPRIFYNLYPIGEDLNNPVITVLTRDWIKKYIDKLWLHYAPDTMRTKIGDIRQFFKWCKKKKHLSKNVAKHVKPIRLRRQRRTKAVPEEDVKKLIDHLAKQVQHLVYRDFFGTLQLNVPIKWSDSDVKVLRDLFITVFLYETGARGGELSKLGSRAMNQATKIKAAAHLITVVGKTNDRDYIFTKHTAELWRIWQQIRPEACPEFAVIGWAKSHPHNRIKTDGISQMLVRRCQEIEIRPFRTHALRHAKVKRSRRIVGLEITSQLIDHSHIDTTRGYANIDDDELAAAAIKTGIQYDIWK